MIAPFLSVVPYVANASVVAGVQTGSSISAASENLPLEATNWNRAVPALTVDTGNRTSALSFAFTTIRRPADELSRGLPLCSISPSITAFEARIATSTDISASVWFCITTGTSARSPKLRNRGARPHHKRLPRRDR